MANPLFGKVMLNSVRLGGWVAGAAVRDRLPDRARVEADSAFAASIRPSSSTRGPCRAS